MLLIEYDRDGMKNIETECTIIIRRLNIFFYLGFRKSYLLETD